MPLPTLSEGEVGKTLKCVRDSREEPIALNLSPTLFKGEGFKLKAALAIEADTGQWLRPVQYERKARPPKAVTPKYFKFKFISFIKELYRPSIAQ